MKVVSSISMLITVFSFVGAQHFEPAYLSESDNPFNPMNINVMLATLDGMDLDAGDEIGIFDGDVCVGAGIVDGTILSTNIFGIIATAQDSDWPQGTGFTSGNDIFYRYWDASVSIEVISVEANCFSGCEFTQLGTGYVQLSGDSNVLGCTDDMACNYNPEATEDDGSCSFPEENYDCDGNCTEEMDCAGVCGGDGICADTLSINMGSGWNWFSVNVAGDDMSPNAVLSTLEPNFDDLIKDQNNFAVYYGEDYGWSGSLTAIDATSLYKLNISNGGALAYFGYPVDPLSTPISLGIGWNWVGYLPQSILNVNDALGTVVADFDDLIKDQNDFAVYYGEDYGWSGSLMDMLPGRGYMLNVSYESDLIYPNGDLGISRLQLKEEEVLPATISSWNVNPRDYEFTATMTISIDSHDDFDGDYVGVFVGDQCRGIAERMEFVIDGSYHYSVMVYSNVTEGEELSFKYYSSLDNEVINYGENVEFIANMNVGNGLNTFSLVREFIVPTEFSLSTAYPNPFNPITTLSFALPLETAVSLKVYNLQGREVKSLVDGNITAGYHSVVWNADNHSSGVYFVKMIAGEYISTQKLMLVK